MRRRTMFTGALLLGGSYLALVGLGRLGHRRLLYPAPRRGLADAPSGGALRSVVAADGSEVQLLEMRAPSHGADGDRPIVVYFHGNGETIADSVWLGRELVARGVSFVAVEYRGYGASPSRGPTETGLYADAEAVLRWVASEWASAACITLFGASLGSGVAVEMAVRGHAGRLVLSTPYTSIPAVVARIVPLLPARLLVADHFDNLEKATRVRLPTLIFHGDEDELVPYDMGVTLARAIAGAELLTVEGGHHNDLFVLERDRLLDALVVHAAL